MIIDWSEGSKYPDYEQAVANCQSLGKALAIVLKEMERQGRIQINTTTLIGFSLGAHVAGFAGQQLKNLFHILGN